MNSVWSLDKLYTGYDDPNFIEDLSKVDTSINKMNNFVNTLEKNEASENLLKAIEILEEQEKLFTKLFAFASLKQSVNTKDADSASYLGRLSDKASSTTKPLTILKKYIANIKNLDELINSNSLLKEYEYFLNLIVEDNKYVLNDQVEEVISKFNISGGSAWSDLQSYLTSSVQVDYKGEKTTLSSIRNLAYDTDPVVRKEAYEAELACYEKIKDAIAFSLNNIKLQVINECKLRGFESPLAQTLHNARMKRETLDALIEAMKEY